MNTTSGNFRRLGGCLLLVLLAGCAAPTKPVPKTYTFFPPAPDEPRIQFLTAFSSEADLGRTGGFADFITGEKTTVSPLTKPYGLALHGGKIFVCDTVGATIQMFDLQKKRSAYFVPRGEGKLRMPINISVDKDGNRYVADTGRNQVVIFNPDGTFLAAIGKKDEMKPGDVAVTGERIYIADMLNHAVLVYSKAERKQLFSIPADAGAADEKLFSPCNLAVDEQQGRLLVSDIGGCFVRIYDLAGKYLKTIGGRGVGAGKFARPKGVAVDRQGLAYVVDAATQVVQMFDPEGRLLMYFGDPGASTQGELVLPAAVKVDYDHVGFFQKYLAPGRQCEYLILVTSQFGDQKVNVYGFLKQSAPAAP
ncbi:MAG: hypothetical protein NTZ16_14565 [Verrucomicrobia bacterium]|nr:hypothetical protein [Verrucomicrobiota bacterium]